MSWSRTYAGAEPIRVNKWLAQEGVCSRREAEALIAAGQVAIDGRRIDDLGRKIAPGETLKLSSAGAAQIKDAATFVIHKPVGYVSAQPEPGQAPAARLLTACARVGPGAAPGPRDSLAPLGRLDQDSRGLLLLSEDGVLAKAVIGPQSELEKDYRVRVEGVITPRKIALLRHGLTLDARALKPARVDQVGAQTLRFVLREGRNRQIRRMAELVDLVVVDLIRTRIGPLKLGDLPEGRWRRLTPQERKELIEASRPQSKGNRRHA